MDRFKFIDNRDFSQLPKTSGVYCFIEKKEPIYIGKAINIQNRVKNHFNQPSYRDNLYIEKVKKIGYLETNSEIEALIIEASLIKKYQPKFNVVWKDGKNYFYVAFQQNKDRLPFVYITHQKTQPRTEYVGPFVEGTALKKTLRFLRRAFPYYTNAKHTKPKCTYCHLDLCPGPNPDIKEYKKNIKKLILILKGKRNTVLNALRKEMKNLSKENKFEEAGKIRDRIYHLQQVMSHTKVISNQENKDNTESFKTLQQILQLKKEINRIECYDVSNTQGTQATGSMVVFENGTPAKNQYKKFKIKLTDTPNDIAMLRETLERRFSHPEWVWPEVILIDGGRAQLNVAIETKNQKIETKIIKVISIAKGRQELFIENKAEAIPLSSLPQEVYNLVKLLDDEAHRFAITYHKTLRRKKMLG